MPSTPSQQSSRVWTVPNALSALRLLGVPVFIWLILAHHDVSALLVLMAAGATDYLDGKIARAFHMESKLGAMLDPAADRLYIAATIVCLAMRGVLPIWVVIVLVLRELFLASLGPVIKHHRLPMPPVHFIGKAATFNLLYAFPLLLLGHFDGPVGEVALPFAWAFALWGIVLYWLAGLLYAIQVRDMVSVAKRGPAL